MPPTLYLAPSQTAARSHALASIDARGDGPFSEARLLLTSGDAIRELQRVLGNRIGLQLFQFYGLARWILDQASRYPGEAGDVLAARLVGRLLRHMRAAGELTSFNGIADKPGFTRVLLEWIREMKSQGIPPEQVSAHARISGRERDRQLALLYQRYQAFLIQSDLSDPDGLLWLAAEALEADPDLGRSGLPFILLGFDHFNPLQLRILKQLVRRCPDFSIYLLWDSERSPRSPDGLALYRLTQTRATLERELPLEVVPLKDTAPAVPVLVHLAGSLFEHDARVVRDASPPALRAVSAPSREMEARYALRRVKQLLLEGVSPHDIALLAPAPAAYLPLLQAVSEEYGVPLRLSRSIWDTPPIAALARLLSLAPDFPRRETLDALRSPYIRQSWLSNEQIELLDRLSRERPVLRGLDQWQFALRPLDPAGLGTDEDQRGGPQLARTLGPQVLASIQDGLAAFCKHLTPPVTATYRGYAFWLQEAVLGIFPDEPVDEGQLLSETPPSLHLADCCRENESYAARDLSSLALALGALCELVEAGGVFAAESSPGAGPSGATVAWASFRDELLELLAHTHNPPDLSRAGVRVGPLSLSRDAPCEHLFVLGMSEGEFPRRPAADVFYSSREREQQPLPLRQEHPAEDASLWWQVTGSARRSLTLLRPNLDENGAPWLASPFWDALVGLVEGLVVEEIPIAAPPTVEQAACHSELLVALACVGAAAIPAAVPPVLQSSWDTSLRCHAVTKARQSWGQPGIYEGFLESAGLRSELAERFGPRHSWSASRLNRYGSCPFGFFAEYVLKLEAQLDPDEGFDAMQQGSLLHAVLEKTFAGLLKAGISLTASTQVQVLECLGEACRSVFASAPQRYGFRPGSLWAYEQRELERQLEALLRWECSEAGAGFRAGAGSETGARFWPYLQEARFGLPGGRLPALVLEDVDGSRYTVHGVIDRVDRDADGNLRVIDYKSGSAAYSRADIEAGLACQTALYALAVEPLLAPGARVVESSYLLIPARTTSGTLEFAGRASENETVQAAVEMALAFIRFARGAQFPSLPGKAAGGMACRDSCDYRGLCRISRHGMAKARQSLAP
jgi:RecB family exonuclease